MTKPIFYMNCMKCGEELEEKYLEESHDVPKYLGGTDKDGRHWLCRNCHREYEWNIFSRCASYLKTISPKIKEELIKIAKKVREDFFS